MISTTFFGHYLFDHHAAKLDYLTLSISNGGVVPFKRETPKYFRRLKTRVAASEEVWVYWSCDDRDEFSRIRNIGMGGLFIETSKIGTVGNKTRLNFLAREGQIRAEAAVCHATNRGLGLKFTAVSDSDRQRLEALVNRLSR